MVTKALPHGNLNTPSLSLKYRFINELTDQLFLTSSNFPRIIQFLFSMHTYKSIFYQVYWGGEGRTLTLGQKCPISNSVQATDPSLVPICPVRFSWGGRGGVWGVAGQSKTLSDPQLVFGRQAMAFAAGLLVQHSKYNNNASMLFAHHKTPFCLNSLLCCQSKHAEGLLGGWQCSNDKRKKQAQNDKHLTNPRAPLIPITYWVNVPKYRGHHAHH